METLEGMAVQVSQDIILRSMVNAMSLYKLPWRNSMKTKAAKKNTKDINTLCGIHCQIVVVHIYYVSPMLSEFFWTFLGI